MKQTVFHNSIQKLLWVRPDSIGDAVLSASMLPLLKKRFGEAEIHVVCQHSLRDFYEACPYIDKIIDFKQEKLLNSQGYREELVQKLTKNNYSLSLNSVRSPTTITDFFQRHNRARNKIDFNSVVNNHPSPRLELESHKDFIDALGCASGLLKPLVWISDSATSFAEELFKKHNLDPSQTVVLSPGVQFSPRLYNHYCKALESLCREESLTVIVIGMERDRPIVSNNLRNFTGKTVDLVGKTSILEMVAIIKKSRMLVGGDSAAAHVACATGTPNAIVLGGGHYRRFFPYSSLTYCAVLHLDCFGCDWVCRFDRPYCVQGVAPQTLEKAVRGAFELGDKRIYFQESL